MNDTAARLDRLEALLTRVLPHVIPQVAEAERTAERRPAAAQVAVIPDLYRRDKRYQPPPSQTTTTSQAESSADPWEDEDDNNEEALDLLPVHTAQPRRQPASCPAPSPAPASGLPSGTARRAQALLHAAKSTPFTRETGVKSAGVGSFKQRTGGGGYSFGGHALQQTSRPSKTPPKDVRVSKTGMVVYIPDGSFVRDKLALVAAVKSKWAGAKEYLTTTDYMQPVHFKSGMSPKDMAELVERAFQDKRTLPPLWSWALLQPATHSLNPASIHSPWVMTLDDLRARCIDTQFICVVPETWENQDHKGFRRAMARATNRDCYTWESLPRTGLGGATTTTTSDVKEGKRRRQRETSSELDREEEMYAKAEAQALADADLVCHGCERSYPFARLQLHLKVCPKLAKPSISQGSEDESEQDGFDGNTFGLDDIVDVDAQDRDLVDVDAKADEEGEGTDTDALGPKGLPSLTPESFEAICTQFIETYGRERFNMHILMVKSRGGFAREPSPPTADSTPFGDKPEAEDVSLDQDDDLVQQLGWALGMGDETAQTTEEQVNTAAVASAQAEASRKRGRSQSSPEKAEVAPTAIRRRLRSHPNA